MLSTTEGREHPALSWIALSLAVALGASAYLALAELADNVIGWLGLERQSAFGDALHFFLYETPKILFLLCGIAFLTGVAQTFFPPARARTLLGDKRVGIGNVLAAGLGVVTPFCSCSAVPLFIGFLSAGIAPGVAFSFLVSAPMVNEVALALLLALFGWKVAMLYLGLGLLVAITAGLVIGSRPMERHLEDWARHADSPSFPIASALTWEKRTRSGFGHARKIVGAVWPYAVAGIALGAGVHGYLPEDLLVSFMGKDTWWAVPAAVVLGIPMYASAAGVIPVAQTLIGKGAALGTVLAFTMSVTALSAPEMVILRKVLKPRLIAVFTGIVASGILLVGYVFNAIL